MIAIHPINSSTSARKHNMKKNSWWGHLWISGGCREVDGWGVGTPVVEQKTNKYPLHVLLKILISLQDSQGSSDGSRWFSGTRLTHFFRFPRSKRLQTCNLGKSFRFLLDSFLFFLWLQAQE